MKTKTRTQSEIAAICGTSRNTLATWRHRPDWPGDDAAVPVLKRYAAGRHADAARKQTGHHSELKRQKLENQVRLLNAQADRAETDAAAAKHRFDAERGQYVSLREYRQTIEGVTRMNVQLLDIFIQNVASKRKDAVLLHELEQCRDEAKQKIVDFLDSRNEPEPQPEETNEAES